MKKQSLINLIAVIILVSIATMSYAVGKPDAYEVLASQIAKDARVKEIQTIYADLNDGGKVATEEKYMIIECRDKAKAGKYLVYFQPCPPSELNDDYCIKIKDDLYLFAQKEKIK